VEQPLTEGNVSTGVVRVGDTVRRPTGPWTGSVDALLRHLERVGFNGAPRALGCDEQGRQVIEYVPGQVNVPPSRLDLAALTRVGQLIRDLHDAAATFVPAADARWNVLVPPDADDQICHHDLAPWNLVLGSDRWVFIDWDTAAPGSRGWDLAYALHGFVPLSASAGHSDAGAASRMRAVVDGYRLDEAGRRRLVPILARRTFAMYDLLRHGHDKGIVPWNRLWDEGHGAAWLASTNYIEERRELWERVLGAEDP